MTYACVDVEVEVDLSQFSDEDLKDELKERGLYPERVAIGLGDGLIDKIFNARRCGKPYDHLLDEFLYQVTGRAI